jgi:hypothetical protein
MDKRILIGSALVFSLLSACGGGGASGGSVNSTPPPPPPPSFTSFSAVQPNSSITVNGTGLEGTMAVSSTGFIPPATVSTPSETSASIRYTTDTQRNINSIAVTGSSSSVSFPSTSVFDTFTDTAGRPIAVSVRNSTGSDQLLVADPYVLGFNYQSFGVWGTGIVTGQTARFGALSAGSTTPTSAIPSAGTANFNGLIGGIYLDAAGEGFRYGANAAFAVNFGTRSILMTTSGDRSVNVNTNVAYIWNAPLSATMTYAPGSSRFSGTFRAGSFMSGTGSGTFYGPAANELGGTFFISGSAGKMVGGFGGKQ